MSFPSLRSSPLRWIPVACAIAAALSPTADGQIGTLKKLAEATDPAKPTAAEKPEDARARLAIWYQDARDALAKLDAPGAEDAIPAGITPAEVDSRRRDLEQMALIATRSNKNSAAVAESRKTLDASRAGEAAWTRFKTDPPYSLLMLDELLDEQDAAKIKLTSHQSSLTNLESILASTVGETQAAEEAVNAAILAVQQAGEGKAEAAKWRLESARARTRLFAARASQMENARASLNDLISAAKADLALIDRKISLARANSKLDDEDLAKLAQISKERKTDIDREIREISKRLKSATSTRAQAQAALDSLVSSAPPDSEPEDLPLAEFRLEVAGDRVDALQAIVEALETLIQLESAGLKAQQDRKLLLDSPDPASRKTALDSITLLAERLAAWNNVIASDISTSGADLGKLESRAVSISSGDPRFPLLNEQRAIISEQLAMLQRVKQVVSAQRKLVKRWIADFSPKPAEADLGQRISAASLTAWDVLKKIWAFEVMSFERKVEIDGETLTGKIPVTLGLLLRALLFFLIAYWLASKLANRIQRTLVNRGHLAEAQAKTLRNWAMIVVGVSLILGTLGVLEIPLTVFAFFGGALAIGLGFGMQTLIKNFISGIIVLVERKVRVGDIVDVNGITGVITEINTRSSVLRGGDGKETLVPNSLFLENRITNLTLSNRRVRRMFTVRVALDSSPAEVNTILKECVERHGLVLKDPAPIITFEDFADGAHAFGIYYWTEFNDKTNAAVVASDIRFMVQKRFSEVGIQFPGAAKESPVPVPTIPPLHLERTATSRAPLA